MPLFPCDVVLCDGGRGMGTECFCDDAPECFCDRAIKIFCNDVAEGGQTFIPRRRARGRGVPHQIAGGALRLPVIRAKPRIIRGLSAFFGGFLRVLLCCCGV